MRLPSSTAGSPNIAGSGSGWLARSGVIGPWWLTARMKRAMPTPKPWASYASWTARHTASAASASGRMPASGGSCATRVATCSGWAATRARAFTAPPLLAKMSTGREPSSAMIRCRSSACCSGVDGLEGSSFVLRSTPRGSYVTIVRSGKWPARVPNPLAPIGDPINSRTGDVVSESAPRMS